MRTKTYRRNVRRNKIRSTKKRAKEIAGWLPELHPFSHHGNKIMDAVYGICGGRFSKHCYDAIGRSGAIKTKTKNVHIHPHRHKGWYGPAINHSRHDRQEHARITEQLKDHYNE